jgi:hypothetical protein
VAQQAAAVAAAKMIVDGVMSGRFIIPGSE